MSGPEGFQHFIGYFDAAAQARLAASMRRVLAAAPLFQPRMPRTGTPFSVVMSNCGRLGWVSDKDGGYRYQRAHPVTGEAWPAMPSVLMRLWRGVGDYPAPPEACLINWYRPGARMGMHVDRDEQDFAAPVISVSLGDDAWFRIGGRRRRDASHRILLKSGDVVVLGGEARLAYHGIDRIVPGTCDLLGEPGRINLTLRRVTKSRPCAR
jgi:alkylated DNA repair protein (DNA oxidative demethylase)